MTPEKKQTPSAPAPPRPTPPSGAPAGRKPWVRKSPTDLFFSQIQRQEKRVADLQEELNREKRLLDKLRKAKEVMEET